jgi:cobalt-zinc-cadmium resistance protein CzcA
MLFYIINYSLKNKIQVFLFILLIIGFGLYSIGEIPIGAVPDVTNNQVQVLTTSRNLSAQDMEQFVTYPVELEMANLPGIKEIRSVSKFGLSVVTLVFEDDMGSFLPRQLISEKIQSAVDLIPAGYGTPEMGPITTGLGEIYQYILDVEPEYKEQYSATDLRTIQDWMVKRQLSGIPGVVEVNTWGGFLKQYEVAINSKKLMAMNISIHDLYDALERNNSISGGGYIEKTGQSYFIRGEGLVQSIEDIESIGVKLLDGHPIYIKDIADVKYGSATRFGAITANGEGEKVMGQIMMLKGADANEVINAVKDRIDEIAAQLPRGVFINPVVERSELIGRTMFTVSENLLLGCLIVIFVVILLLGNVRSGLVIASVIPLSLLFALSMMNIFGVDANLMSLGAIDFGIIIDGAVIIVEFIAFKMTQSNELHKKQSDRDEISLKAGNEMMKSAIFGQLIILIVFIPILTLRGVEGKMFIPMAMTFGFALIGAMILCLTYVPVVSSLFLKPPKRENNLSQRMMQHLSNTFEKWLSKALKHKITILGLAGVLFILAIFTFSKMGAEFVPTLDEGDFVIQPVLPVGTSLSKTVEITTKIEKILKDQFPEVKQVVSRIGAAEVPTDPMSMEESDVIITLKPKSEWVSASTKDELADRFKEVLSVLPIELEFTQPIEMRFNELITGVRADIAIKIFGEDLSVLANTGDRIKSLIKDVPGAADIILEKVEGLPQMNVNYNRQKIARYGLDIRSVNDLVSMGFGGKTVGQVYEGEKRFDLVIKLDENARESISDLQNLFLDLPSGQKIPLKEVAEVSYKKGAAKISRDNTQRRTVVGINVRNRDLQSVVEDVQQIIDQNIKLPEGYHISYGGQFENLNSAKKRLGIAIPIALFLIFLMLYFAFNSVKDALIIFTAIPFSAIGGIFLLWFRDLPFSISAGVGFIALFGIAVLNGIVLIEHYKSLSGSDPDAIIIQGTKDRLRAVLLTATAAALGFLPMAISTNAGAEVQRPLATVVIGGLISSTLLTLFVLPLIYTLLSKKRLSIHLNKPMLVILFIIGGSMHISAQKGLSLSELNALALQNNKSLQIEQLRTEQAKIQIDKGYNLDKTGIFYGRDENNLAENNIPLNVFGIQQDIAFPTTYVAHKKVQKAAYNLQKIKLDLAEQILLKQMALHYNEYQIALARQMMLIKIDSLYQKFSSKAETRYRLGGSNYLEKITAEAKQMQLKNDLNKSQNECYKIYKRLSQLTLIDSFKIQQEDDYRMQLDTLNQEQLVLNLNSQKQEISNENNKLKKQKALPDISVQAFNGFNKDFTKPGFQVGLKLPLFYKSFNAEIKETKIKIQVNEIEGERIRNKLKRKKDILASDLESTSNFLNYHDEKGSQLIQEILKTSNLQFEQGEIDFFQFIQSIEGAYHLRMSYLEDLKEYNQTIIELNYLYANYEK